MLASKTEVEAAVISDRHHEQKIAQLRAELRQALRQWKMYAECEPDRDLKSEKSTEADIYRAALVVAGGDGLVPND